MSITRQTPYSVYNDGNREVSHEKKLQVKESCKASICGDNYTACPYMLAAFPSFGVLSLLESFCPVCDVYTTSDATGTAADRIDRETLTR